jgi:hypothetical protein
MLDALGWLEVSIFFASLDFSQRKSKRPIPSDPSVYNQHPVISLRAGVVGSESQGPIFWGLSTQAIRQHLTSQGTECRVQQVRSKLLHHC